MNQHEMAIDRALAAKARLAQLRRSPDFVKKYVANDVDAVDAVRHLTRLQAAGVIIATDVQARAESERYGVTVRDANIDASSKAAFDQQVQALQHDPTFAKKLAAGDPNATRQWRELMVDGAAFVHGVSALENKGPTPVATAQPEPGAVGAVSGVPA